MTKYHINKHGTPAPCRAKEGSCPLGGATGKENHFDRLEDAEAFANEQNEKEFGLLPGEETEIERNAETVEGYDEELEKRAFSRHVSDRLFAARRGYATDVLVNDENANVRITLAQKGYEIEKLARDEHFSVRSITLNENSHQLSEEALEGMAKDENYVVRRVLAEKGLQLDKLVDDEQAEVRGEVALHGHGLNKLVNDESAWVRDRVARQGYGLDVLENDESPKVRAEVARQGHALDKLAKDESPEVRKAVALQGHALVELENDEDKEVRAAVEQHMNPELYHPVKREHSFSVRRMYSDNVKGVRPVDYKTYAAEHGVSIPEAAKMRMKENLDIVSDGGYKVEFEDDNPKIYMDRSGKLDPVRQDSEGLINDKRKPVHYQRINRLIKQYKEAREIE